MENAIEITELEDPELDVYARLTEGQLLNRFEPEKGMFVAETPYVILRALDGGCEPVSLLVERGMDRKGATEVIDRCGANVPIYVSELDVLTKLTGFKLTRGMLCAMRRPRPRILGDVLQDRNTLRRVVVLERVMNPTNVGAIFRSAAALGMDAVLLTPGCSDPLYRRSARVSMGTVFQIPWTFLEKENWMEELRERGYKTAAMALTDDSYPIDAPELRAIDKLAIVMGSEGDGLRDETVAACDYAVKIPMFHNVDWRLLRQWYSGSCDQDEIKEGQIVVLSVGVRLTYLRLGRHTIQLNCLCAHAREDVRVDCTL